MKVIKRELGLDIDKLKIIPISDTHIGDKTSNTKAFKEALERIKNEENTYTILNGDLCNIALKTIKRVRNTKGQRITYVYYGRTLERRKQVCGQKERQQTCRKSV